jgi:hypothetical protein
MASPAQIAANQRNSRKSTGPSTPQGRARSSMNALKHGYRSRKLALLREESCAVEVRLRKWMAIGDAQNDIEFLSGMGESGENLANEANCDESMSVIEVHDTFQVIANSDAFSGLDNGGGRARETHAGTGD